MGLLHRLWQQWQKKAGDNNGILSEKEGLFTIVPHFINGERLTVQSDHIIEIFNPHSGQAERQLYAADAAQIEAAVTSSMSAKKIWAATPLAVRLNTLLTFRELLHASTADLIQIVVQEQGISHEAARAEIEYALSLLDDVPQWTQRLGGRFTPNVQENTDMLLQQEPVGVVLGIECSRLPVSAPVWLISMALSCGNCILFRPSLHHPSIAIFLADLLKRAGLPEGVFNVLQGGCDTTDALLHHQHSDALLFHNILPQDIPESLFPSATRTSLAATSDCRAVAVVMPDADMKAVANTLSHEFVAGCQNGQHLCAILAVGNADLHLGEALQQVFIHLHKNTNIDRILPGALPSLEIFQAALRMKETVRETAAEILWTTHKLPQEGWYAGMMLADCVTADSPLLHQPHALPILPIIRVPDWPAAQTLISENPLFNSIGLFGEDLRILHSCAEQSPLRQIGINTLVRRPHAKVGLSGIEADEVLPFLTRTRTVAHRW